MLRSRLSLILLLMASVVINSCGDDDGGNFITDLFFPVEDDIKLGAQLRDEIAANPGQYPVLSETQYPEAYGHLRRIRDEILNSGEVTHRDDFAWEVRIIQDDSTLNAFAAPGGFIYVYTGLIKFLDNESEFAGVIGHEIAHADRRHSVNQLSKAFGVQLLLDVTLGQGAVSDVLGGLVNLSFSRSDESDADEHSVIYLCPT
ncbi:MAG: M48 family metalloprotease, partial [Bacteroidota bacterium]